MSEFKIGARHSVLGTDIICLRYWVLDVYVFSGLIEDFLDLRISLRMEKDENEEQHRRKAAGR